MRLASDKLYDAAMRLPVIAFNSFWLIWEFQGLRSLIGAHPSLDSDWAFFVQVAARIVLMLFLLFLTLLHLVRRRPLRKFDRWQPKIDAVLGLTIGYFALLLPRPTPSPAWDALSIALIVVGNFFCILIAMDLGRSLSVMPEARRLITEGFYRRIRHPLYLAEMIAFTGLWVQFRSLTALLLVGAQFFFQIRRMMWEEQILAEAFDEYADYRSRSWRLIPGVY